MPLPYSYGQMIGATNLTLGSAAGRSYALGNVLNPSGAALSYVHVRWLATATVGTRVPVLQLQDSAGDALWTVASANGLTASQNLHFMFGSGVPPWTALAGGLFLFGAPLPDPCPIPPNASIAIFDQANIDVNDTLPIVNAVYIF